MGDRTKPLKPGALPSSDDGDVDLGFHSEITGSWLTPLNSALITDDGKVLTGPRSNDHSFLSCAIGTNPKYPDPYLQVSFDCVYHAAVPASEPTDDEPTDVNEDQKVNAQGYKTFQRGCVKLTCQDVADLKFIELAAKSDENTELHGKTFAEAISNEGRAIVPPDLLDKDSVWKVALKEGRLHVLRVELNEDVMIKTIGMHPPYELGDQNAAWLQISNHLKQSRSLNLVLMATPQRMESIFHRMAQAWTEMRTTPGPFYQFYGNHPDKPFVKSGTADDNVPFDQRPVEFDAPGEVGFMHPHEYNATLAYGYIDENDFQNRAIQEVLDKVIEVKFLEVPHTLGREFVVFAQDADLALARLQPGDPLKYTVWPIRDNPSEVEMTDPYAEDGSIDSEQQDREDEMDFLDSLPEDREEANLLWLKFKAELDAKRKERKDQSAPKKDPIYWTGRVGEYRHWVPEGWGLLYAIRPFDKETNAWDNSTNINALSWNSLATPDFIAVFKAHPCHKMMIRVDISKKERKQILAANHEMYMKRQEMKELWDLLLMQRVSDFRPVDFYETIEGEPNVITIADSFNQGQKAAFDSLRRMRSFAVALHGPPGTGKTHWACKILAPLVEHKNKETGNHHVIYAMAATNEQADKFAVDLHSVLKENVQRKDNRPITVIRLLPWHVEDRIAAKDREDDREKTLREDRPEDANVFALIYDMIPPSTTPSLNEREQAVEKMLLQYRNSTVVPSSSFTDPRIRELPFHLGTHMIQELKADDERDGKTQKWANLQTQIDLFKAGTVMGQDGMDKLRKGIRTLRDFVLMNADVLVSTPYAACQGYLREIIKPSHIVIDEASQISEPRLWPTLAWYTSANNPSFKAMVLMGDHLQIPPTVLAPQENCPFRSQLRVSLFYRLIANGLSLPALYQQRRMHKDIAAGPKQTYYGSRLRTHMSTNHFINISARSVRQHNKSLFQIVSNVVLIDIPEGQQKVDNSTKSSYNEENVEAVVALIVRLLEGRPGNKRLDDICILTFYSAQARLHQQAMMKLHADKPGLGADKVKIATADRYQGHEANIVILDLVIVHKPGFTAIAGRMNSALTRAKSGLYVIASVKATVDACKEMLPRSKFMAAIFKYWISQKIQLRPKFIVNHIQDWKAARERQALEADADEMNTRADVGRGGEITGATQEENPHGNMEHEGNDDGDFWT